MAFLDDDDFWAPAKLRTQLGAVRASGADFAFAGVVTLDESGRVLHISMPPEPERLKFEIIPRCVIPAGSSNVLVRTELARALGGFDESFRNMEDWDFWIRLASAGKAASVAEVLVACVEHRGGKAVIRARDAFEPFDALVRKHRQLTADYGVDFDRVAFTHYVAWLQLRGRRHASAARVYLASCYSQSPAAGPSPRHTIRRPCAPAGRAIGAERPVAHPSPARAGWSCTRERR